MCMLMGQSMTCLRPIRRVVQRRRRVYSCKERQRGGVCCNTCILLINAWLHIGLQADLPDQAR